MPSSGSCQMRLEEFDQCRASAARAARRSRPTGLDADWQSTPIDLAVDVELELLGRGVADPTGVGSLVARQPWQLELGQPPLAADPVHDLDLSRDRRRPARSSQSRQACASSV